MAVKSREDHEDLIRGNLTLGSSDDDDDDEEEEEVEEILNKDDKKQGKSYHNFLFFFSFFFTSKTIRSTLKIPNKFIVKKTFQLNLDIANLEGKLNLIFGIESSLY